MNSVLLLNQTVMVAFYLLVVSETLLSQGCKSIRISQ